MRSNKKDNTIDNIKPVEVFKVPTVIDFTQDNFFCFMSQATQTPVELVEKLFNLNK